MGLINTVVLARLLAPSDFGMVAMAMVAQEFIRVFAETGGLDLAVIRHPSPTAEHYDTAWTMSVCAGVVTALALVAIAPVAEWYFHEPRVVRLIWFLSLAPLIVGFTNVGVYVGFRRDLEFDKEFRFLLVRKLAVSVIAVPLAFIWRDYWALAIGVVCGGVVSVIASYWMHTYRPRFRLTKLRELWSYSAWMQIAQIGGFFGDQTDQIIVGGLAGTVQMGTYNVAADLATAPTGELVAPAARAVFPVYATLLQDPARLAGAYLSVLSITAIVALSTGVGTALVADDLVAVVLGPKWTPAAALVPWLAVAAGLLGVAGSVNAVLSVTGNARLNCMRIWAFAALLVPAATIAGLAWGAAGVAAARMIVSLLFIPVMFYSLTRVIPVTGVEILRCLWRPALATLSMVAGVQLSGTDAISVVPLRLFCNVGVGAVVFSTTLLASWLVVGRPDGAERLVIAQAGSAARSLGAGTARRVQIIRRQLRGQADV